MAIRSQVLDKKASLTYALFMTLRPITVFETQMFARAAEAIWSDDERSALIDFVARNPENGDLIPGTGGVRKLRWGRTGSGKRGGARVIYFFYNLDKPLYMLLAYAKSGAVDMTPDEKRAVSAFAAIIKGGLR